jgi:uncharacterized protein (UPF0548 family)
MQFIWPGTAITFSSLFSQWKDWRSRPTDPRIANPPANRYQDQHVRIIGPYSTAAFERISDAILTYQVFPKDLGTGLTPLKYEERYCLEVGDTVMFCWRFLLGIHLGFGCRVNEVFLTPRRVGFSYQTLVGHPELGEETFELRHTEDDQLEVRLTCWSVPGTWLCKLVAPLSRHWQLQGARRILDHLESQAHQAVIL